MSWFVVRIHINAGDNAGEFVFVFQSQSIAHASQAALDWAFKGGNLDSVVQVQTFAATRADWLDQLKPFPKIEG